MVSWILQCSPVYLQSTRFKVRSLCLFIRVFIKRVQASTMLTFLCLKLHNKFPRFQDKRISQRHDRAPWLWTESLSTLNLQLQSKANGTSSNYFMPPGCTHVPSGETKWQLLLEHTSSSLPSFSWLIPTDPVPNSSFFKTALRYVVYSRKLSPSHPIPCHVTFFTAFLERTTGDLLKIMIEIMISLCNITF